MLCFHLKEVTENSRFSFHLNRGDPELLLGGGANPWGGGRLPNILVIFSEKPYEIKEILVRRGGARRVRPPQIRH